MKTVRLYFAAGITASVLSVLLFLTSGCGDDDMFVTSGGLLQAQEFKQYGVVCFYNDYDMSCVKVKE